MIFFLLSSCNRSELNENSKGRVHEAAARGNKSEMLGALSGLVDARDDEEGKTPLMHAAGGSIFIEEEIIIDGKASKEKIKLCSKAKKLVETAEELIKLGANVNESDYTGMTPLMYAAEAGNSAMVLKLIAYGANLQAKDLEGNTASHYARNNREILNILNNQSELF